MAGLPLGKSVFKAHLHLQDEVILLDQVHHILHSFLVIIPYSRIIMSPWFYGKY